eukprot:CAMPEP_0204251940 /NCGR_PEP_ID=MMETSP0468-20130131/734_1 /ASSEMBLY_ACC=CAM_ASM_000383 /TAXON_ID=2969 /ORGANISM="Oxyrrhis marina" /LENGTH=88 /DNA_ID=CAMNT_0051225301 /DNA_START=401 /DNA_END=667 /DNA_ORIENTATION=+
MVAGLAVSRRNILTWLGILQVICGPICATHVALRILVTELAVLITTPEPPLTGPIGSLVSGVRSRDGRQLVDILLRPVERAQIEGPLA